MKTRLLMVVISLLMVSTAFGQSKFNLSGIVMEKGSNDPIMSATVQVCNVKDTSLVTGAATDVKGAFKINGVKKGQYLLKISFIGYHNHVVSLNLNNEKKKDVDLGYFTLTTDAIMLKEAQVTANAAKVQVKGDSLVYNADAYRLPEGSALEDLVKKLPGATIEDDGTIKINGKEVKKILVDGKEFFINDKNIALKNLPTNIIDKIKSYDRKSDLSRITGIDDGEDETVLDLTVKKGMNNGWFGQISGGVGTERRYNARANVNRFNGPNQYSLVSSANNVGDRGFGGGGGRGFGWGRGGNGLLASKELGFNFASEIGEKLEAGGYVWHRYDGSDAWSQSTTQNFVSPSGAFSNSSSQNYTSNASLSSGFRFEWKPDSMWNIIFRPNFNYSRNRGSGFSSSRTYDVDPNDYSDATLTAAENDFISGMYNTGDAYVDTLISKIVNTNDSRNQSYSNSVGGNGELQINRKLNSTGRNITLRLTGGLTNSESKSLSAARVYYRPGTRPNDINNRYNTTPGRTRNFSVQTTYSEPIADRTYLQFSYRFNYSYNKSDRQAYDYLSNIDSYNALVDALRTNRYDIAGAVDDMLSRGYTQTYSDRLSQFSEYKNLDHTISLTFRRVRDNYNFNFGLDFLPQHSEMDYHYLGQEYNDIKRNVFNFAPNLNFRYRFNETTNLQFRYRARSSQPSMTSLLDIEDDSNPLNITKGNPRLKPSFNQNFMLFYNTFNAEHQRSIFTNVNFSFTQNQIAQRVYYDTATGVRTTMSENINGNWNAGGGFGFNTALDANKAWTIGSMSNVNYSNSVSYLDPKQYKEDKSTTKTLNLGERLELGYRNDWFEVSLNGNINFNHSNNNVILNSLKNTFTFSYGTEININAPWGTTFNTDIAMNSRRGFANAKMNTNELIWNVQASQSFLRGRALTLSLEWNDILGQRSNISRTINAMMSSDTRYNAIYSYGMLRVIYKLNIFGGKNANGTSNERDMWGRTASERGNRGGGRPGGGRPGGGRPRF